MKQHKAINDAINDALSNLHTAIIARVENVNASTVDAVPVINRIIDDESHQLPLFKDVPVITLQGGGTYLSMPVKTGDYCLLIINERCFDDWYHGADFNPPLEKRMHDYSDAFAIVGVNPLSTAIPLPISDNAVFNGDLTLEGNLTITGDLTVEGDILADGKITATSAEIDGDVAVSGKITADDVEVSGDVIAGGISLKSHTHIAPSGGGQTTTPS